MTARGSAQRPRRPLAIASCFAVLALCATQAVQAGTSGAGPGIIPYPLSITPGVGAFSLPSQVTFAVPSGDRAARQAALELKEYLAGPTGLTFAVAHGRPMAGTIALVRAPAAELGPEGYRLTVTPERVMIAAAGAAGWFYGGITLWQLIRWTGDDRLVDGQVVEDRPRFAWRGLMLDSARHFQSPAFIRRFLDGMALHKLNVLHWHLTDDQAWRIEIRKYPALTAVGAFRVPAGPAAAADIDPLTGAPRRYGGYYTQSDVRGLVAYAARRHITIVPEIDLPGHTSAAIASYPELGVHPGVVPRVPSDWGVYAHVLTPTEHTFRFLADVFDEVVGLFPGPYVHIGGDEVLADEWQQSAEVRARTAALGLATGAELRHYFARRVEKMLRARGRRAVGWDEILEPRLSKQAVVMSWRGSAGASAAARQGNDTVMAPDPDLYLDHRQGTAADEPPGRAAVISVRDIYGFDPVPTGVDETQSRHLLGVQANLWTEHVRTETRAALMVFPRAAALAEVGWSSRARHDWTGFQRRLASTFAHYRKLGLPFDESLFTVTGITDYDRGGPTAHVTLIRQAEYGDVRYTLDGSDPTAASPEYRGPLTVSLPQELRAASFIGSERVSTPRTLHVDTERALRRGSHDLKLCTSAVALALEDDAPLTGPRAVFLMDIENPCWIYPAARLRGVTAVVAAVGQVPFNFQIGADRERMHFATPQTSSGELELHLDDCNGEVYARMPLETALPNNAVTVLSVQPVRTIDGDHDLCIRFAQRGVDPLWALDWIELRTGAQPSGSGDAFR